jgi:hypothetical protein
MVSRRTIRSWIQGAKHERRDGGICDFVCHPLPQQKVEKNFSGCSSIKENQGKIRASPRKTYSKIEALAKNKQNVVILCKSLIFR